MTQTAHNKLVSFIWSIADDCLRDVYVRGKYRDVILPMVVLRRLDALLESTKDKVMEEVAFQRNELGFAELDDRGLRDASGYVFYNTSEWTLQRLHDTATNNQQIMLANFEDYLNGFSDNVKEIIDSFNLRSQVRHMSQRDVLLDILEKFTSPRINLTPMEKEDPEGRRMPPLTNLGMGYVFEELIRKFNEENNEEAGEHFTPREVINLMTTIVFTPIQEQLPPVMTVYDPACGSGGMLTESQYFIKDQAGTIRANSDVYLFGKEINDETYAICKSDMMIKGDNPENIRLGSTLATDEFAGTQFDFMLSNPPYGKSWSSEMRYIKDGAHIIDPRFVVRLRDYWGNEEEADATPRSSDGQLLFLMEMVDKMKDPSQNRIGSRIASVHNGSSLFTGDAGGGESNIRRHIIENDWLDCIVQLPNNLFYNTGITTYIWFLNNAKPAERQGKVLLIDASERYSKLRKNLGEKNCELTAQHIEEIKQAYLNFEDIEREGDDGLAAKVFDNADFGYYRVTIDRPQRLKAQFSADRIAHLRYDRHLIEPMQWAYETYGDRVYTELDRLKEDIEAWTEENNLNLNATRRRALHNPKTWVKQKDIFDAAQLLMEQIGTDEYSDYNHFAKLVDETLKEANLRLTAAEKRQILQAVSWYDEQAEKVIKKKERLKGDKLQKLLDQLRCTAEQLPDYGYYPTDKKDEYVTYEPSSDLRDTETIPLSETVHDYFLREVKPHISEAWIDISKTRIGYEISFNKYFYQHTPLRSIEEVSRELLELEQLSEGLIKLIIES